MLLEHKADMSLKNKVRPWIAAVFQGLLQFLVLNFVVGVDFNQVGRTALLIGTLQCSHTSICGRVHSLLICPTSRCSCDDGQPRHGAAAAQPGLSCGRC